MFKKFRKPIVQILSSMDVEDKFWCNDALLIEVVNGKGALRREWAAHASEGYVASFITLNGTPILQAGVSACPTCASLLAAGYGIENAASPEIRDAADRLNEDYTGLEEAVQALAPLLGLLEDGVYALADMLAFPTDGEGRYFWGVPSKSTPYDATAGAFTEDWHYVPGIPVYLYPGQGVDRYNAERVQHYASRYSGMATYPRAVALHIGEFMNLVLDGHHKATAMLLAGKPVPCITIMPCTGIRPELPGQPGTAMFPGLEFLLQALPASAFGNFKSGVHRRNKNAHLCIKVPALPGKAWPTDYRKLAKRYPTVKELAEEINCGIPDTTDAVINQYLGDLTDENARKLTSTLRRLSREGDSRLKATAMSCARTEGHPKLKKAAFEVLALIKDDPEIEQLFIDHLVADEDKHSELKPIADSYWDK